MSLPEPFRRITLHLARNEEFPNGSDRHGYVIVAPLDEMDRFDVAQWRANRELCRVRRFTAGEEDEMGRLVRRGSGAWVIDYDPDRDEDDEAGYRLGDHAIRVGEYVSITDEEGDLQTYRIAAVDDGELG